MGILGSWDKVAETVTGIINKVVPDRAAAAAAAATFNQLAATGQLQEEMLQLQAVTSAQTDINKVEAANPSIFVAGPRPAVMWICAAALGYQFVLRPSVTGIALLFGHPVPSPGLPGVDDNLYQILYALLGLGAMRSFDKVKGVATKAISFGK